MNDSDKLDDALRYALGDAAGAESERIEARLATDAELRADVAHVRRLQEALQARRADSFAPYFSDRVMRRLASAHSAAEPFYESLRWIFARASVAAATIAVAVGAYNVIQFGDLSITSSWIETAFGLPSASLMDAFLSGPL